MRSGLIITCGNGWVGKGTGGVPQGPHHYTSLAKKGQFHFHRHADQPTSQALKCRGLDALDA